MLQRGKVPFIFFVLKQTDKVQVYKKAFISLHGVTEARVRRQCDLLNGGNRPEDKRGRHPKANMVRPEICQKIHEKILCFPRKKTHYSRTSNILMYVSISKLCI